MTIDLALDTAYSMCIYYSFDFSLSRNTYDVSLCFFSDRKYENCDDFCFSYYIVLVLNIYSFSHYEIIYYRFDLRFFM